MNHAILILAHSNYDLLCRIVRYFTKDCDVFIHLDRDFKIGRYEYTQLSNMYNVVHVLRKYHIKWGSFNILRAELLLLDTAYKESNAEYFHLFSGEDYPIKPLEFFLDFFNKNFPLNYLHARPIRYKEVLFRFMTFSFYGIFDGKTTFGKRMLMRIKNIQERIEFLRDTSSLPDNLYIGSQWFSITRNAVYSVLKYKRQNKRFYLRLRYTFAPDEIFIQTALHDSLFHVCEFGNNCRLIYWGKRQSGSPEYMGLQDFKYIAISSAIFARKVDNKGNQSLLNAIDKYLLNEFFWRKYFSKATYNYNAATIITSFCKMQDVKSMLDIKCGAGLYVATFVGQGILANGLETNVEKNIHKLMGIDDLIIKANFFEELSVDEDDKYDMLFCSDAIILLDNSNLRTAIINFIRLTECFLIIQCKKDIHRQRIITILQDDEVFPKYFHLCEIANKALNKEFTLKGVDYSVLLYTKEK